MLSNFHLIPERDGQTDEQNCYINIARQYADAWQKWNGHEQWEWTPKL